MEEQSALASLSAILGYPSLQGFELVENVEPLNPPSSNIDALIDDAFAKRPELLALNYEYRSQEKLHDAQRDQLFPTISAPGSLGLAPVRNDHLSSWYGAVGVNVAIPVFNGFRFTAQAHEADLRAQATQQEIIQLPVSSRRSALSDGGAVKAKPLAMGQPTSEPFRPFQFGLWADTSRAVVSSCPSFRKSNDVSESRNDFRCSHPRGLPTDGTRNSCWNLKIRRVPTDRVRYHPGTPIPEIWRAKRSRRRKP